jgi:hypothetical protein
MVVVLLLAVPLVFSQASKPADKAKAPVQAKIAGDAPSRVLRLRRICDPLSADLQLSFGGSSILLRRTYGISGTAAKSATRQQPSMLKLNL